MKAETHPEYHEITVVMTDGTEYKTRSTFGKEGEVLKLDVDPLNHPAWQGGTGKVIEKGQLDKFEGKYGSFLTGAAGGDDKKAAPKEEEAKEAPVEDSKE